MDFPAVLARFLKKAHPKDPGKDSGTISQILGRIRRKPKVETRLKLVETQFSSVPARNLGYSLVFATIADSDVSACMFAVSTAAIALGCASCLDGMMADHRNDFAVCHASLRPAL